MNGLTRSLIVEAIGPFALMFAGGGAIIATGGKDLVAIALAHGLGIGLMVTAAGLISGGVYNPAITVGLVAARKLPLAKGAAYVVAQLVGGLLAALALKALYPASAVNATQLATPQLTVDPLQGVIIELILTFFLQFVIFGTAIDRRGPAAVAGLAIGLTITMDVFAAGAYTGAAMNPARSFGPALVQGFWANQWVYWVGPILGALAAALLYSSTLLEESSE